MAFLKIIISWIFYLLDRVRDTYIIPMIGSLFITELRLKGAKLGKVKLYGKPIFKMHPNSEVALDDNVSLNSSTFKCTSGSIYAPCKLVTICASAKILIGKDTGLNGTSIVARSKKIIIGQRVAIAPNVVIMDSPFHKLWPPSERNNYSGKELDTDIYIGDDVWISTGCILLPGASIGKGSVVAARSLINKKFPKNCLIGGMPAKIIKEF